MAALPVTAAALFDAYHERLALSWLAGEKSKTKQLLPEKEQSREISLIGHLNFIHPHRIQVLGSSELAYLSALGKNSYQDALNRLFAEKTAVVIITNGAAAPQALLKQAERTATPLIGSALPTEKLIDHLSYYLSELMAEKLIVHGVFMDVMGIGVLLTGESAVGKSELALELITRGHHLVADDAPEFTRTAPDTLRGSCPEVLQGFMEVRGLGVLNVKAMFGDNAVKHAKKLELIVHLAPVGEALDELDRLRGGRHTRRILEVDVPAILLPVAPGRNLAVLVEAAARNHILYDNGYDAAEDFIRRQQQLMENRSR